MNVEQAIKILSEAIGKLADAGYVTTGELSFCIPAEKRFTTAVNGYVQSEKLGRIEVGAEATQIIPLALSALPPATSADVCIRCGSCNMIQSGACKTCADCGESGGCG